MNKKETISSTFGRNIKVTIFGGSHEEKIGCIIEGLPEGAKNFNGERLQQFLDLRAPGSSPFSTPRKEPDKFEVESEDPLTLIIRNTNQRSGDYKKLADVPRPGHADYTARIRYGGNLNMAGGGPFSGRMTAPLCIAGGIALQVLEKEGIKIGAHLLQVGEVEDRKFNPVEPEIESVEKLYKAIYSEQNDQVKSIDKPLAVIDADCEEAMASAILAARDEGDSLGGIVEVAATGIPAGIGGAMYDGLESILAPIYFGIPAVKGIEFGLGFESSKIKGSKNNDSFDIIHGDIITKTNHAGGILGGITTGMPLIARLAFKPTPSIAKEQQSVNMKTMEREPLVITGRHDPCVAVRAVPVVIAATAIGILDAWQEKSEG